MEFGFDCHGNLLLADVLNNNSWHINQDAQPTEKSYRDSIENNAVAKNHRYVRDRTAEFRLPKQQIIIWRGSEKDDVQPFIDHIKPYMGKEISVTMITCPAQKDPITAYRSLLKAVQATPDCVVVIFITMRGNTAGSLIAANTLAPTIAVPLNWQEFPDDIWSSLRNSSDIPLMTILDPANAGLAALQILAKRNPRLYSVLQMQTMSRLQNVVDM
jgi:phosphoribosylcarboxyaminoimidazole (NCAIR) mutase